MEDFLETHKLFEEDSTQTTTGPALGIPAELTILMGRVNSNSYANGFLKFIVPDEFRHYFSLWNLKPDDCFPFIKSAFGCLIFFHEQQYKVLNSVYNNIDLLGEKDEIDFVMDIVLCDRPALESSFCIDIYEQAFGRLGPPKLDEIYAFIPALGLGGSRNAASVEKANMETQMLILSQI
jgi:hypothetical protein